MSPVTKLQYRVWRIENAFWRRVSTVLTTAFVVLPAHVLFWICAPILMAVMAVWAITKAAAEELVDCARCILGSLKAEPREWREIMRVFKTLWRCSESEREAEKEAARIIRDRSFTVKIPGATPTRAGD